MLEYANSKGIPVWTASNLLDFIKMRDEASFNKISWSNNQLSFTVNSTLKHSNGLTVMIPAGYGGKKIKTITKNGEEEPVYIKKVKGSEYAFVTVEGGADYAFQVNYEI